MIRAMIRAMTGRVLVLGIGNLLMGDDGVGIHVLRALPPGPALPAGTTVVEGGTAGLALLPLLVTTPTAIVVDAVDVGADPGSVHLLPGRSAGSADRPISVHQAGCADLLAAAQLAGARPDQIEIVGIQPARVAAGMQLSPVCRAAVPPAVSLVIARAATGAGGSSGS